MTDFDFFVDLVQILHVPKTGKPQVSNVGKEGTIIIGKAYINSFILYNSDMGIKRKNRHGVVQLD